MPQVVRLPKVNFREERGRNPLREETPLRDRSSLLVRSLFSTVTIVPQPQYVEPVLQILDVSKWQGAIDFVTMKDAGCKGVWIKVSQGDWVDVRFQENAAKAAAAEINRGFYHFMDPNQSITPEAAAIKAADLTRDKGNLSMWLDIEWRGNLSPSGMADYIQRWVRSFQDFSDLPVEFYTRMGWFNTYVARSSEWKNFLLCAARYNLALSTPWSDGLYEPLDWPVYPWGMWQYSADGNGMGAHFGCSSTSVDLGGWRGTQSNFDEHYDLGDELPPPTDCCKVLEVRLDILEERVSVVEADLASVTTETRENTGGLTVLQGDFGAHQGDPAAHHTHTDPPPIDPPPSGEKTVQVREGEKAPAFASERENDNGAPVIDINVYDETRDPELRWDPPDTLLVDSQAISADGGLLWYIVREDVSHYGYDKLYVRKDKVKDV